MDIQLTTVNGDSNNNNNKFNLEDPDTVTASSDIATADAKLLVEIAEIQATLDTADARVAILDRELQQQLEHEGEDLCDVDESLRHEQGRLSVLKAAGRASSQKAQRIAQAVQALEQITSTIDKRANAVKHSEFFRNFLRQKMQDFMQQDMQEKHHRSTSGFNADKFVSNRKRHKPAAGRPSYTGKDTQSVFGNEISCCCSSMQGTRPTQEDGYLMRASLPFAKHFSFFSVFDGHGGSATSKLCEAEFLPHLHAAADWTQHVLPHGMGDALTKAYMTFDASLKRRPEREHETTGATALSALISPTHIVIANLGECRAVLVRGGKVLVMSNEHKPRNKFELQRIKAAGGAVFKGRVMGELAVARAFGDFSLKDSDDLPPEQQMVSCQPQTRTIERSLEDDFLVLACDGVWDVMSNDELVEFIGSGLAAGKQLQSILNDLLDRCLQKRSRDNMTVMVVDFRPTIVN